MGFAWIVENHKTANWCLRQSDEEVKKRIKPQENVGFFFKCPAWLKCRDPGVGSLGCWWLKMDRRCSPSLASWTLNQRRSSNPTWASLLRRSLARSRETRFARPNSRACSQATLELVRSKRDAVRKAREAHLIHKRNTLSPLGINRCDEAR